MFFYVFWFCFLLLILRLENQMIEWKVLCSKTYVKYNLKNVSRSQTTNFVRWTVQLLVKANNNRTITRCGEGHQLKFKVSTWVRKRGDRSDSSERQLCGGKCLVGVKGQKGQAGWRPQKGNSNLNKHWLQSKVRRIWAHNTLNLEVTYTH